MMNNCAPVFSFTYLPLMIRLKCLESANLPAYLGSALHGIVGWSLQSNKKVYKYLFENRGRSEGFDIVNPYIIDPPLHPVLYKAGDELRFQLVLLGDAVDYTEEVICAMAETRVFGLGSERKQFELFEILHGHSLNPMWRPGGFTVNSEDVVKISNEIQYECTRCSVQLLTPLRIRRNGKLLNELDFLTIIRNITRRLIELTTRYGGVIQMDEVERILAYANQIQMTSSGLYLKEMQRYSSRKNEKDDFSGILGSMTFEGDLCMFRPWLNAAQVLHIGRNVTFGCGRINVICG